MSLRWPSLVLIGWLLCAAGAKGQSDRTARELVNKAIAAHGGSSVLSALATSEWKGRGLIFKGDDDKKPLAFYGDWSGILPGKYRYIYAFKAAGATVPVTTGLDGEVSWRVIRPNAPAEDMPADRLKNEKDEAHAWYLSRLAPLLNPEYQLMSLPAVRRNEQMMVGLKVDRPGYRTVYLYFHQQNHQLMMMERKVFDPESRKDVTLSTTFGNFKRMGDALLPQSITIKQNNQLSMELDIQSVKPLSDIDEARFKKPPPPKE